jgi:multiple RNA-binding domain-containing protein 1
MSLNAGTKRKRSELDESDPKLKEFMEVMQPASKPKTWNTDTMDDAEPPTKMQAIELPEAESDEEYEAVPKMLKNKSPSPALQAPALVPVATTPAEDEPMMDLNATDDDWLRNRTNRLLDLMGPEDVPPLPTAVPIVDSVVETNVDKDVVERVEENVLAKEELKEELEDEKPDPTIEAIKSNGRLFVRNLPYSATEDDLREHFAPFGSLEEVCSLYFLRVSNVS